MIRPLRGLHRSVITVLAVLTPLVFVLGLLARQSIPHVEVPPTSAPGIDLRGLELIREDAAPDDLPIRVRWLGSADAAGTRAVQLELTGAVKLPDLLVYWEYAPGADGTLSDRARLLGRVGGRRQVTWAVPEPAGSGWLVFYSGAWKVVAGTATPP